MKTFSLHSGKIAIVATILSIFFSSLFFILGKSTVGLLIGLDENFYLKFYYDFMNQKNAETSANTIPDSLTIINIRDYSNRKELASILNKVYDLNPKVIGLDVFFEDNPDIKDSINQELVLILKKIKNKIVLPCYYKTDDNGRVYTKYPFFKNVQGLEDIKYASPLAHDFLGVYQMNDSNIHKGDTLSPILRRMSYEIAIQSQMNIKDKLENSYINYTTKNLLGITVNDTAEIRPSNIEDKIVIIGNISEIKDMVRLPFNFGNKKAISGVEDVTYSLISIINWDKSNSNYSKRFDAFTGTSKLASICMSFIFRPVRLKKVATD